MKRRLAVRAPRPAAAGPRNNCEFLELRGLSGCGELATTFSNGSLGSGIDEERSEMR